MMELFLIFLWFFGLIYIGWLLYLAVMALKAAHEAKILPMTTRLLAYPAVGFAYLFDVLVLQIVIGSILFLEPPLLNKGEWTLSQRLGRLNDGGGWRGGVARWMCKNLLDPFDIKGGGHCG